ncbi:MAG: hypothetical protein KGN40_05280 [Burkholderiales bacterium]|nr:hypothetical protein [Burkholderiales bacterium]
MTYFCKKTLEEAIPSASHPLHQFHLDPVAWLKKCENRTSLANPEPDLAYRCQVALGLPLASCEAIVKVWQRAISVARRAQWHTPAQLQRILNQQFAQGITAALADEHTQRFVSDIDYLMLQMWLSNVQRVQTAEAMVADALSASSGGRKRPATREAPDAPPTKEPRT